MNVFEKVPVQAPAKNVFNLNHSVKSSYTFDKLYPFLCQPIYPGDTFNCRAEVFLRCMPLLAPVMHRVDMKLYFFFVPMRLIWNEKRKRDWKVFITGGEDGLQEPELPFMTYKNLSGYTRHGDLMDHMGFPSTDTKFVTIADTAKNQRICSLPFRAYQMVYNEYFRNQNIQNEIEFSYDEGEETIANIQKLLTMRSKNYELDYFTSCLPFAQRGKAMTLPVDFNRDSDNVAVGTAQIITAKSASSTAPSSFIQSDGSTPHSNIQTADPIAAGTIQLNGNCVINAGDLCFAGFSMGTINDFRYCLRLQQWMENNARCGSRYIEQLLAHFGVVSSDSRLQRPELLGGGSLPLLFTDIEQNSYGNTDSGDSADVLGNLGGKGTMYGKTQGFKKYFEEHGILLGILTIIPRTSYSQGIPRVWTAFDKTDWYFPEFAHLGEQAVLNKELFFRIKQDPNFASDQPDGVFGYQGRFSELRYIPSSVHGAMKSSLQYWHLGRLFYLEPSLNSSFIEANTPLNSFAIESVRDADDDPFVAEINLDIKAVRPLPKYAIPTI